MTAMICHATLMLMHQRQPEAAQANIKLVLVQGSFGAMALGMGVALYSLTTENELLRSMIPGNAYFMFQKEDIIPVLQFVRDQRQQMLDDLLRGNDGDEAAEETEDESEANGEDRTGGGATAGGDICPGCSRDGLFDEGCCYCEYKPEQTLQ